MDEPKVAPAFPPLGKPTRSRPPYPWSASHCRGQLQKWNTSARSGTTVLLLADVERHASSWMYGMPAELEEVVPEAVAVV